MEGNLILAYLSRVELDYDKSIEKYNNAIQYFKNYPNIEVKAFIYYELSSVYIKEKEYYRSEQSFKELEGLFHSTDNRELLVKYRLKRSNNLNVVPNSEKKTLDLLTETLDIAKKIKYNEIEDVYFQLGKYYWHNKRLIESMHYKIEALKICEDKKNEEKICEISVDVGIDYLEGKDYNEAIKYLSKVLKYNIYIN